MYCILWVQIEDVLTLSKSLNSVSNLSSRSLVVLIERLSFGRCSLWYQQLSRWPLRFEFGVADEKGWCNNGACSSSVDCWSLLATESFLPAATKATIKGFMVTSDVSSAEELRPLKSNLHLSDELFLRLGVQSTLLPVHAAEDGRGISSTSSSFLLELDCLSRSRISSRNSSKVITPFPEKRAEMLLKLIMQFLSNIFLWNLNSTEKHHLKKFHRAFMQITKTFLH